MSSVSIPSPTVRPQSWTIGDPALAARLSREVEGEVLFDRFSRGRYSTDASIYQIEPIGVVVPRHADDIVRAMQIAADQGVPVLARGGGTSQCGQTVGEALVIDVSKHVNQVLDFDPAARRVTVQPGLVLDRLNAYLRPHGLMFPVDVSTGSQATIGGMTGNNSCGARSIRYGTMRHNVRAIAGILADGTRAHFGPLPDVMNGGDGDPTAALRRRLLALGQREAAEIAQRFPKLQRRVGGYNVDALTGNTPINLAHLLVGSEGTLAISEAIELDVQPIPPHAVLGVCHFPTFRAAMEATQHIVALGPAAVELVDQTMIELSREIAYYRDTVAEFVRGTPAALLLVEFAGESRDEQRRALARLHEVLADLGHAGAVVDAVEPAAQKAIWEVRKAGLNIMMSMKGDGKPISFIEDCAVPLADLADYTDRLTEVFRKHGTHGTWYAHASEGCLHVRPVLNLKLEADVNKMRAMAEEAFAMVREYKGSHSGEHGDGLVRSEFHEPMFGSRMVRTFEEVKDAFDPDGRLNPGKIVRPPRMDNRQLFRYPPDYRHVPVETTLDWSAWGGFASATEMCNNNGACRKRAAGVMCPSYRVTLDERHVTRGRANSLRLALSGQLGPDALTSPAMAETMSLCVGCKGCRRECPTGVDMARMKIEVAHQAAQRNGLSVRERLIAYLPRYAPIASRLAPITGVPDRIPGGPWLREKLLGLSAQRPLPQFRRDTFRAGLATDTNPGGREVVLLADTFNTYFEPQILRATVHVLTAAGYRIHVATPADRERPLCCGRTFLAAGLVNEARTEARRTLDALRPYVERGLPIIGVEPACLLTLRDEFAAMLPGTETAALAGHALLLEEFLAAEMKAGSLAIRLGPAKNGRALLHGHCHQKAFGAMSAVESVLRLVPGLAVETVESSCCGMAGAFGYAAETYDVSMAMGELSLLPAVRKTPQETVVVADGTSCRQQIRDGTGRRPLHVAEVLEMSLQ